MTARRAAAGPHMRPWHRRACAVCACTDNDCRQCIAATGQPCSWVSDDMCSRCRDEMLTTRDGARRVARSAITKLRRGETARFVIELYRYGMAAGGVLTESSVSAQES